MTNEPVRAPETVSSVVPVMYVTRMISFACAFAVIGIHLREEDAGPLVFLLLGLQFLVYPILVYLHLHRQPAHDRRRTVHAHLHVDSFFLGAWVAGLGFPAWIGYSLVVTTMMNATIIQGLRGIALSGVSLAIGGLAGILVAGFRFAPETSPLVTKLCMAVTLAYVLGVGLVAYQRTVSLIEARRAQTRSEERYRLIAENAGDMVMLVDKDCRLLYASPSCSRMLPAGYFTPGVDAFRGVLDEDWLPAWTCVRATLRTGEPGAFAFRVPMPDNSLRALTAQCHAARDDAGNLIGAVIAARDVTDVRHHEEQAQLAARAFERMSECMMITDAAGNIVMVNDAYSAVTGYGRDEVIGRNERDFRSALQPASFYDALYAEVARDGHWSGTTWSQRKGGTVYREWRTVSAVRVESGEITHYVNFFFETGVPGVAARVA